MRRQLDNAKDGRGLTVKRLEGALARAEERLKALTDSAKDPGITFEETGIDYVFADEAHGYKNLRTVSNIEGVGVEGSQRASDLDMKLGYLRERHGGRVATFATATPIANSVAEAYTMQRWFLRPDLLDEAGLTDFDTWAATFGGGHQRPRAGPGRLTVPDEVSVLRSSATVPELLRIWHVSADIKTAEDLQLPTPDPRNGRAETVVVPATEQLTAFMGETVRACRQGPVPGGAARRRQHAQGGHPRPHGRPGPTPARPRPGRGRQAHPRPRTGSPPPTTPTPSGPTATARSPGRSSWCSATWAPPTLAAEPGPGWPADGTSTTSSSRCSSTAECPPNGSGSSTTPATTRRRANCSPPAATAASRYCSARPRRWASAPTCRPRAVALHHLDCPWRPADIAQREGRILRQGNLNPEVEVIRYVSEGSFDAYLWQTVERKARFIGQGDARLAGRPREIEDVGETALSYSEVKALATGDPRILEKAKVDARGHPPGAAGALARS